MIRKLAQVLLLFTLVVVIFSAVGWALFLSQWDESLAQANGEEGANWTLSDYFQDAMWRFGLASEPVAKRHVSDVILSDDDDPTIHYDEARRRAILGLDDE